MSPSRALAPADYAETARDVAAVAKEKRVSVLAAGLAYHAFNSLIPAVILAVLALSTFGGFGTVFETVSTVTGIQTTQFVEPIRQATGNGTGQLRAFLIAGVVFVWSTGRLFEATQQTFTEMYGADEYDSRLEKLRDIGLAFVTILVGAVLVAGLGIWLVYLTSGWLWRLVAPFVLFVSLVVVFVPMYYLFPRADVSVREVLPGTTFAAAVWTVSAIGFSLYATTSESVELYGVAGGVLLLLTWMYVVGLALPLGTILNVVVSESDHGVDLSD